MAVTIERQPIDGFKSLGTLTSLSLVLILVVGWQSFQCIRQIFRADLRKIPGPRWARITAFWRPWVLRHGQAPEVYYELHQKYGPLVRTAPAVVSISDPGAISTIYGIGTKYYKVRAVVLLLLSSAFTSLLRALKLWVADASKSITNNGFI